MNKNIDSISPKEFKAKIDSGNARILDIRTPEECLPENGGMVSIAAVNIDFYGDNFVEAIDDLDRTKSYGVYCRRGIRSAKALELMKSMKFINVKDLEGGMIAWHKKY